MDRAIDLFQQMSLEGLTPTIETYNTILQSFFHMGRHVEAQKFYKMMLNKGLKLNMVTCPYHIRWTFKNQYVDEALSFFI